jgi:peptide/nickel transport system permease protein
VRGFVLRRLLWTTVILFAITVMVFLVFFAIPGVDPVAALAGRHPAPATVIAIRHTFGLDQPLPVQYYLMMKHLFVNRDVVSYTSGLPILPQVVAAVPVTLSLVAGSALIWVVVSIAIGVVAATFQGRAVDRLLMIVGLIAISAPVFWVGSMANLITQGGLHSGIFSWVPPPGYVPLTEDPVGWFRQLIIPWLVLSFQFVGLYSRVLRSSIVELQGEDFARAARAKGLSERRVLVRHVLRMSLIPFVSLFGLDLGALIGGGVVLVEVVFGLPGVGLLAFHAASSLDLPTIMVTVIYGAFFIVVANLLVDIAYGWLDPRIRQTAARA